MKTKKWIETCCDVRSDGFGFEGGRWIEIGHLDDPIIGRFNGGGGGGGGGVVGGGGHRIQRDATFEIEETVFESARHSTQRHSSRVPTVAHPLHTPLNGNGTRLTDEPRTSQPERIWPGFFN